jgi:membrane fusion protein (multidrug efflux system)
MLENDNSRKALARPGKSRGRAKWWVIGALIAVCGVAAVYAATRSKSEAEQKPAVAEKIFEFAPTDVATAGKRELRRVIAISGALAPVNQATVKAKVAAEVAAVPVLEGETVQAGQVLVRLDQTDTKSRYDAQRAMVDDAKAKLVLAQKNRDNNGALLRQNFISQNAYDNTESGLLSAQATVDNAVAQLRITQQALDDTLIKAPMAGVVAKRYVQRGDKAAIDAPTILLVDLGNMQMEASVPASDIPNVQIGQEVEIRVDGFDKRRFSGKVDRINPIAEAGSRSIMTYVRIQNPKGELRGGMFAQGEITMARTESALTVPMAAVQAEGDRKFVFVIDAGKLQKQEVVTGATSAADGMVEIKSGLTTGATVIAARFDGLKNGAAATIKQQAATPPPVAKTGD